MKTLVVPMEKKFKGSPWPLGEKIACQCGGVYVIDSAGDYVDYPSPGKRRTVAFDCPNCESRTWLYNEIE